VEGIVDQLETDVQELDDPDLMNRALRSALADVSDVLAEGIVAQVRENTKTHPRPDRR
jgi:hypothetical protein